MTTKTVLQIADATLCGLVLLLIPGIATKIYSANFSENYLQGNSLVSGNIVVVILGVVIGALSAVSIYLLGSYESLLPAHVVGIPISIEVIAALLIWNLAPSLIINNPPLVLIVWSAIISLQLCAPIIKTQSRKKLSKDVRAE